MSLRTPRPLAIASLCGAALFGCRPKEAQHGATEPPARPSPSLAASVSAAPLTSASARALPPLPEGCFAEVPRDLVPAELLRRVVRDCQLGAHALDEPARLSLEQRAEAKLPFELARPTCLRFVAAGADSLGELQLSLLDSRAVSLGEDELEGNLALLKSDGPICVDAGQYMLRTRALEGSGDVWVQGFTSTALTDTASTGAASAQAP